MTKVISPTGNGLDCAKTGLVDSRLAHTSANMRNQASNKHEAWRGVLWAGMVFLIGGIVEVWILKKRPVFLCACSHMGEEIFGIEFELFGFDVFRFLQQF
jgi:hypothetical protein